MYKIGKMQTQFQTQFQNEKRTTNQTKNFIQHFSLSRTIVLPIFHIKLDFILSLSKQNSYLRLPKEKHPEPQMERKLLDAVNRPFPSQPPSAAGGCAGREQARGAGGASARSPLHSSGGNSPSLCASLPCPPLLAGHAASPISGWFFFCSR